jgi:hypothetical protein
MREKTAIATVISIFGWIGLVASLILAVAAMFDPPRGVPALIAPIAYIPHILGSLLTIGAGEALAYLADIAAETEQTRRDAYQHDRQIIDLLKAANAQIVSLAPPSAAGVAPKPPPPNGVSREMLDRAAYNGWDIWPVGDGRWRVTRGENVKFFDDKAALDAYLESLPARK